MPPPDGEIPAGAIIPPPCEFRTCLQVSPPPVSSERVCKSASLQVCKYAGLRSASLQSAFVAHRTNYVNFKPSKDVEKNPGPTQYNTDHHEVIIRPFMQNHSSTMRLISPISSENLMQSRLGERGLQSIDVGGASD